MVHSSNLDITKSAHKERMAKTAIRIARLRGHEYVDLRKDRDAFVFFCTLCLTPCFGEKVLYDHLKGKLHKRLLRSAKATLLKPNPWPFNDGMFFFDVSSCEENKQGSSSDQNNGGYGKEPAIVSHAWDRDETGKSDYSLVVRDVHFGDEVLDIGAKLIGIGKIGARIFLTDEDLPEVCKIWCEWFGNDQHLTPEDASEHDFAVILFPYSTDLGTVGLIGDIKYLLSKRTWGETTDDSKDRTKKRKRDVSESSNQGESSSGAEDDSKDRTKKRKRDVRESSNQGESSSGAEDDSKDRTKKRKRDVSESSNQGESSHGATPSLGSSSSRMLDCQGDDQPLVSKFMARRTNRKDLREYETEKSKRAVCFICCHKMLQGKDVAALFNIKTGKLACSSRNKNGHFQVFHVSCLILWILLSENEIYKQQSVDPKMKQKPKIKTFRKFERTKEVAEVKVDSEKQINFVFCPECQGTGLRGEEDKLETGCIDPREFYHYKLKMCDGKREWMKSPEMLENCSIGLHFPPESEEPVQERVEALKLLRFYRANMRTSKRRPSTC